VALPRLVPGFRAGLALEHHHAVVETDAIRVGAERGHGDVTVVLGGRRAKAAEGVRIACPAMQRDAGREGVVEEGASVLGIGGVTAPQAGDRILHHVNAGRAHRGIQRVEGNDLLAHVVAVIVQHDVG
jgi:hypothetical protein